MPPASDDPAIREALAALRTSALQWLIGGSAALLLGALLWGTVVAPAGGTGRGFSAAGLLVLVLGTFGAVAAVAGGGALLRTRRWARALPGAAWQDGWLRISGPGQFGFEPSGSDASDAGVRQMRLLSTAVWRTRAVHRLHDSQVRAAPVGGAEWVLTADGHRTLYGARVITPRT